MKWKIDEWQGCYPSNWKGVIVPAAMSHPAKFSSKLIRRIYEHMKAENWLKEGDMVLDPFGGVSLGALDAMRLGLRWRGIELEAKFAELGNHNLSNWNLKFHTMPHWCQDAKLLQGDSRFLLKVLGNGHNGAVSSPPYADGAQHTGGNDPHPEKMQGGTYFGVGINGAVSSPPYADTDLQYSKNGLKVDGKEKYERPYMQGQEGQYGSTAGQLGAMKAENFEGAIAGAVSSPPYADSIDHGISEDPDVTRARMAKKGQDFKKIGDMSQTGNTGYGTADGQLGSMKGDGFNAAISSPPFRHSEGGTPEPKPGGAIDAALYARHAAGNSAAEGYGGTDGQLANMPEGDFQGAVSSPPFVGVGVENDGRKEIVQKGYNASGVSGARPNQVGDYKKNSYTDTYGTTEGNLGIETVDDFWLAARQIVEQVYLALAPGAHTAWVVKGFVKNKEYVDFPDQWRQLCEAVGFVTVHEHRALLSQKLGSQHTTEGDIIHHEKQYASFFRRLAEKKGSPKIKWETVWCMVKPVVGS